MAALDCHSICPVATRVCGTALGKRMQLSFRVSGKRVRQARAGTDNLPSSSYLLRGCPELGWNNDNSDVTRDFPCGKRMRQPQKSNTAARVCRTHEKYIHLIWRKGAATTCGKRRHGMAALGGKIHRRVDISELIKALCEHGITCNDKVLRF